MADVRTYLKTRGTPGGAEMKRVDAERVRVDWRDSDGHLITSQVMADSEAREHASELAVFMDPPVVPTPEPVPSGMPAPPGPLTWSDEFDGTAIDPARWSRYDGPGHGGNGLRDPNTWTVEQLAGATGTGRAAICTAWWDESVQKVRAGGMSARKDGAKFGQLYGRFECRAKFDPDPSGRMSGLALLWPIGWGGVAGGSRPVDETRNINLVYGELDFAESLRNIDAHRRPMYAFMHWPNVVSGDQQTRWVVDVAGDEWHTYTLDWSADRIVLYVDGVERGRMTDRAKIPTVPFTPCLQLDCFSNGQIGRQRAFYDYVKVWGPGA